MGVVAPVRGHLDDLDASPAALMGVVVVVRGLVALDLVLRAPRLLALDAVHEGDCGGDERGLEDHRAVHVQGRVCVRSCAEGAFDWNGVERVPIRFANDKAGSRSFGGMGMEWAFHVQDHMEMGGMGGRWCVWKDEAVMNCQCGLGTRGMLAYVPSTKMRPNKFVL